jgi:hypothetical protein
MYSCFFRPVYIGLGALIAGNTLKGALVIAANDDESLVFFRIRIVHSMP